MHDLAGRVVDQLVKNVKEIHELGVKKIAILGSPPRGCWPQLNPRPRTNCNATWNEESRFHNQLLTEALKNVEESEKNAFVFLDLYKAMDLALQKNKGDEFSFPLISIINKTEKMASSHVIFLKTYV